MRTFFVSKSSDLKKFQSSPKVLSQTAKLCDLLGLLAPFVIRAKILIQSLWQKKKIEKKEFDLDHEIIWRNCEKELTPIKYLKLLRWNGYHPQAKFVKLHGFADASVITYGALLYLRVVRRSCDCECYKR